MTYQAIKLIIKLKKAQIEENGEVYIDDFAYTASTVTEVGQRVVSKDIDEFDKSLNPTLSYLESRGYIEILDRSLEYCRVTHAGWHWFQVSLASLLLWVAKSVLVPVLVAYLVAKYVNVTSTDTTDGIKTSLKIMPTIFVALGW